MAEDGRTPGWSVGAWESCPDWTADQHAEVAATLLDSHVSPRASEDAWNGEPPQRFYEGRSDTPDLGVEPAPVDDLIPFLAALVHVGLAIYKSGAPQ